MAYRYTITERASLQYEKAIDWYVERSLSAGKNFYYSVETRIQDICEQPKQFRNTKKNFREAILKKYPFSIIYTIDETNQSVIITSIFHHKQHPKQKYK